MRISLKFVPYVPVNNKSALVQMMSNGRQAIICNIDGLFHWHIYASLGLNELKPKQSGCHILDNFKGIFLREHLCILIPISLKFVP